jgi:hypothetical protein
LEEAFATEFESKMNEFITPKNLPRAEDVFGDEREDDGDVPF